MSLQYSSAVYSVNVFDFRLTGNQNPVIKRLICNKSHEKDCDYLFRKIIDNNALLCYIMYMEFGTELRGSSMKSY